MAVQYPGQVYTSFGAETTFVPENLLANTSSQTSSSIYLGFVNIQSGFLILHPKEAEVLQPFFIKIQPVENGFIATSHISDVYELGETSPQAASSFLSSLVDELIWFNEHKQSLSSLMLKNLEKLQSYVRLV